MNIIETALTNEKTRPVLPRDCTFAESDWRALAPFWYPIDKDAPLQPTLNFNHQVFDEDKAIVEKQFPEDLPIDLQEEVHIRADKSSITYRQGLAKLGLGRSFTA